MENSTTGLSAGERRAKKGGYTGEGVQLSMNGTIHQVNLNLPARNLKSTMINDNTALITLFQEMFGCNKAPMYSTDSQVGDA